MTNENWPYCYDKCLYNKCLVRLVSPISELWQLSPFISIMRNVSIANTEASSSKSSLVSSRDFSSEVIYFAKVTMNVEFLSL